MKIILKNSITCSEEVINTLSERFILEAMDHPFIVKLHYAFQSESKLYLLCDLMPGVAPLLCRASFFTSSAEAASSQRKSPSSTPPKSCWHWSTCTLETLSTAT